MAKFPFKTWEEKCAEEWMSLTVEQQNDLIYYAMTQQMDNPSLEQRRANFCLSDIYIKSIHAIPEIFRNEDYSREYLKRVKYKVNETQIRKSSFYKFSDEAFMKLEWKKNGQN